MPAPERLPALTAPDRPGGEPSGFDEELEEEYLFDDEEDDEDAPEDDGEVRTLDLTDFDHGDRRAPAGPDEAHTLLTEGVLDLEGRLLDASNVTLIGAIRTGTLAGAAVYKPVAGERPLWDFPDGTLAGREISAYLVSEATGWSIVPPTVLRDGPFGPGMVQLWMDADPAVDLQQFVRRDLPELRRIAVFDAVVNNADRKGGHLIPMRGGHVYGVDHGVCFSVDPKLRTLLWRWAGKPLPVASLEVLERLADDLRGDLGEQLHEHLTRAEVRRTQQRVDGLLRTQLHPEPSGDWPALPWPPF
ncbi:SCO1664 family protein [Modestobacter sp. NPDC049651]|uniref:SCO1664 family protein n=1 Tax=unclassified Modestobacter TaxID=2643866 RepID=UPI0033FC088B